MAQLYAKNGRLDLVKPAVDPDAGVSVSDGRTMIAKHFHAPLQSGCDRTLRRMHRKYRPRHYADRILKARALASDAAIGADVMAGFPGETNADFEESRSFIESLPFTYLHVFTYSERPGTPAAGQLHPEREEQAGLRPVLHPPAVGRAGVGHPPAHRAEAVRTEAGVPAEAAVPDRGIKASPQMTQTCGRR